MKLLFSIDQLEARMAELGEQISTDYASKRLLIVGALKGCTIFMGHLLKHIKGDLEIDFMTLSSYKHGAESGELKLVQDLDTDVAGRHVLILEDIIDTGKTLSYIQKYMTERNAASVETVTLINKEVRRENAYSVKPAKYIGFEYDQDPFVVGFGFDYREYYRNLAGVYMMDESDKNYVNNLLD